MVNVCLCRRLRISYKCYNFGHLFCMPNILKVCFLLFVYYTGTNDKAGGPHYVLRWTSPQAIKETFVPLKEWKYQYMSD